jgi:hypothetical protein
MRKFRAGFSPQITEDQSSARLPINSITAMPKGITI